MAPPNPCSHCGNTSLQILPNMMVDPAHATTIFGKTASKSVKGTFWAFSLVICTQCGCTQMFTANAAQLAQHVSGSQITTGTVTP